MVEMSGGDLYIEQGWWWKTTYLELKVSYNQSSAKIYIYIYIEVAIAI